MIQISPRLIFLHRENDIFALAVEAVQDSKGRGVQYNRLSASLAVR